MLFEKQNKFANPVFARHNQAMMFGGFPVWCTLHFSHAVKNTLEVMQSLDGFQILENRPISDIIDAPFASMLKTLASTMLPETYND